MSGGTRRAVVALGSNLGDRAELLRAAVAEIDATAGVSVVAASAPVSSVAVTLEGPDESKPEYLNAVLIADVDLEPLELLDALAAIEQQHGRVRDERWGDRTLDLDIVALGDVELATERLTLPHPRAAERAFVLEPWLQVDPEARLGRAGRVADLLELLPDRTRVVPGAGRLDRPPTARPEPDVAPTPPDPTPTPTPSTPTTSTPTLGGPA